MLATQMNDKVTTGVLNKHTVLRLDNYVVNTLQNKR